MSQAINIFVSNRIDLNSVQIPNYLYIPVYCGAIFRESPFATGIVGDNTGDNISNKRNSYCEFTVQYWAWKNIESRYYGLCHYRRYLSFSKEIFTTDMLGQVNENFLDERSEKKYNLLDSKRMKQLIEENDVVVNKAIDITNVPTPQGKQATVYGHWAAHDKVFIDKRVLPILISVIQDRFPEYYAATQEYLYGRWHRGYNCYIMKRKLFYNMCEFQFGVLTVLEDKLSKSGYIGNCERTIGYLGEILYGIYIYYLSIQDSCKIKELQMVYFEDTETSRWFDHMKKQILFTIKHISEPLCYMVLPKASKRRNFVKKYYFKLIGK